MSGKRRKQQQRSRGRRPDAGRTPQGRAARETERDADDTDAGVAEASTATVSAATASAATAPPTRPAAPGRPVAASRYASSVSGPRRTAAATSNTGTIDIDERVPYFSKDLRRIVITAGIMVVVIIAGSLLLH